MSSTQHSVEAITIGASQKLTVGGGAVAAVTGVAEKAGVAEFVTSTGSLDVAGICALGGLFLAFVGYFTSLYFQWRRDRRESVESDLRRKRMFGVE
jgi:hypothetical protein